MIASAEQQEAAIVRFLIADTCMELGVSMQDRRQYREDFVLTEDGNPCYLIYVRPSRRGKWALLPVVVGNPIAEGE